MMHCSPFISAIALPVAGVLTEPHNGRTHTTHFYRPHSIASSAPVNGSTNQTDWLQHTEMFNKAEKQKTGFMLWQSDLQSTREPAPQTSRSPLHNISH